MNLYIEAHISLQLQLEYFHQNRNRKVSFLVVLGWKTINSLPALESWWTRTVTNTFNLYSSRFWNSWLAITTDWFLLSRSQSCAFCLLEFFIKHHWFSSMQWTPAGPKMPENATSFGMPRYSKSYFFRCTYFFSSNCQSIAFYLRRTVRFQVSWSLFFASELESWVVKSGSVISIDISRYSNSFLSKTTVLSSSISVWIDGSILLIVRWPFIEQSLVLFLL